MVDLHTHILPHLDDGAFDAAECFIWLRPVTGIIMIIR